MVADNGYHFFLEWGKAPFGFTAIYSDNDFSESNAQSVDIILSLLCSTASAQRTVASVDVKFKPFIT